MKFPLANGEDTNGKQMVGHMNNWQTGWAVPPLRFEFANRNGRVCIFEKKLAIFKELGDRFFISRVSSFLECLLMDEAKYKEAGTWVEEHNRIDTELKFWDGIAEGWCDLGYLYKIRVDDKKSQECLNRCREICTEHGLTKTPPSTFG